MRINERIATEVVENTVVIMNAEEIEIQNIDPKRDSSRNHRRDRISRNNQRNNRS
jgi:hypothetical protein